MAEMPVSREALLEARKNAMSKKMYGASIKLHCLECIGEPPKERICQGCPIFEISTQERRRKFKKTEIKKIIREFCIDCVGTQSDVCQSPNCALYAFRKGEKMTKEDWKQSIINYKKRRRGWPKEVDQ